MHTNHNEIHTDIDAAMQECADGLHVSHVTNKRTARTVTFRPAVKADKHCIVYSPGVFDLDFSDPEMDLREQPSGGAIYNVPRRRARRLVETFLRGFYLADGDTGFSFYINQAERWCDVTPERTPTRVRINYELPHGGTVGAWWYCTTIDGIVYLSNY